jgi:hypothetical protein
MDWPGICTCIILDKKYNIANSSCHFGSYGSIWNGSLFSTTYMINIYIYIYICQLKDLILTLSGLIFRRDILKTRTKL